MKRNQNRFRKLFRLALAGMIGAVLNTGINRTGFCDSVGEGAPANITHSPFILTAPTHHDLARLNQLFPNGRMGNSFEIINPRHVGVLMTYLKRDYGTKALEVANIENVEELRKLDMEHIVRLQEAFREAIRGAEAWLQSLVDHAKTAADKAIQKIKESGNPQAAQGYLDQLDKLHQTADENVKKYKVFFGPLAPELKLDEIKGYARVVKSYADAEGAFGTHLKEMRSTSGLGRPGFGEGVGSGLGPGIDRGNEGPRLTVDASRNGNSAAGKTALPKEWTLLPADTVESLIAAQLKSGDSVAQLRAIKKLAVLGPQAEGAVEALKSVVSHAIESRDGHLLMAAAEAFGNIGSPLAIKKLGVIIEFSGNHNATREAIKALGKIGGKEAIQELEDSLLWFHDEIHQEEALKAIKESASTRGIKMESLKRVAVNSKNPSIKRQAVSAIVEVSAAQPTEMAGYVAIRLLKEIALTARDFRTETAAITALGAMRTPEAVKAEAVEALNEIAALSPERDHRAHAKNAILDISNRTTKP